MRVKRSVPSRARRKKWINMAKGYRGPRRRLFKNAKETVEHALQYAYHGRKRKKRDYRSLWIIRINAAARNLGLSYSKLINALKTANITLDRKVLAYLALKDGDVFAQIVAATGARK
jgi:large subunit ribosomal protein L20